MWTSHERDLFRGTKHYLYFLALRVVQIKMECDVIGKNFSSLSSWLGGACPLKKSKPCYVN
jgi:hypothetical protein